MAAGLGFKTFNTGDVLSAADVNGYLMQGVLVFADATARDAAITSPQEGQFAYTKDNNSLWYYSGSAWVSSGATGDIEGVTAGVGISGGGTSGTVTITNSMATAIDAKGDLVVGTGADTFSKLTVGANGTILTADSAEATGMKWAAAAGGSNFVGCLIYNANHVSISGGTGTIVSFDSEIFDTDSFHDNATNNSRITIPSGKAGKYLIIGNTQWQVGNTYFISALLKNGTKIVQTSDSENSGTQHSYQISRIEDLAEGDYIQLRVQVGATLDLYGGTDLTTLSVVYLGA